MSKSIYAAITAVGGYVPDYILTNHELERIVETSDEWIRERSGISERRILKGPLGSSYMGIHAVQEILRKKQLDPLEIDLIICSTVTPDMVFPATAALIAHEVGAHRAWGYDIEAACSGFLFGLTTGAQFIESGNLKKVIVVGVDKMSSIINYEDRNTCVIFGDGGAAVLLEPDTEHGYGLQDFVHFTDGGGAKYLHMKAGGSVKPASFATVQNKEHYVFQEGKQVFKHAIEGMSQATSTIMERNGLTPDNIDYLVPHQANRRIIDATAERMGMDPNKVMINIMRYGNTTSGTIPLCLWNWEPLLRPGQRLVLASFGGGFSWGSVYLKWAYDGSVFS
jgi:3-oxoacyl-[acyl-carrier-protein] synthase III